MGQGRIGGAGQGRWDMEWGQGEWVGQGVMSWAGVGWEGGRWGGQGKECGAWHGGWGRVGWVGLAGHCGWGRTLWVGQGRVSRVGQGGLGGVGQSGTEGVGPGAADSLERAHVLLGDGLLVELPGQLLPHAFLNLGLLCQVVQQPRHPCNKKLR